MALAMPLVAAAAAIARGQWRPSDGPGRAAGATPSRRTCARRRRTSSSGRSRSTARRSRGCRPAPSCGSTRFRSAAPRSRKIPSRSSASSASSLTRSCRTCKDLWAARAARPQSERGGGGHILTGPIYVEGAAPGDTLAVEMLELTTRVPYGINATSSTGGRFRADLPRRRRATPCRRFRRARFT